MGLTMKVGNQVVLFDEADRHLVEGKPWYICKGHLTNYAIWKVQTQKPFKHVLMHCLIMGTNRGIDHINGNGLDNRRCNLRLANPQQNALNRPNRSDNKTGFKGVILRQNVTPRYCAMIGLSKTKIVISTYSTPEEAARAYDRAMYEWAGPYARLNFPEEYVRQTVSAIPDSFLDDLIEARERGATAAELDYRAATSGLYNLGS